MRSGVNVKRLRAHGPPGSPEPSGRADRGSVDKEAVSELCFLLQSLFRDTAALASVSLSPLQPLVPVCYDMPHLSFTVDPWARGTSVFS